MNSKDITKKLQALLDSEFMGILTLDRAANLDADAMKPLSLWIIGDKIPGRHSKVLPAKELRKLIWKEEDNRWMREGRGVAWAVRQPDTDEVIAGIGIVVPKEKGMRMQSLTGADVYIENVEEA